MADGPTKSVTADDKQISTSPLISPKDDDDPNLSSFYKFLHSKGLGECVQYFPESMTLEDFSQLSESELIHNFQVHSSPMREVILHTIASLKPQNASPVQQRSDRHHSDSAEDEIIPSRVLHLSSSPIGTRVSPPRSPSPCKPVTQESPLAIPDPAISRRMLQRTLSEGTKGRRRRESMPQSLSTHTLNRSHAGSASSLHHLSCNSMTSSCGPGSETSNLLRIRNSLLGHSAPNLTDSLKDLSLSRRSSGRSVSVTSKKVLLPHSRCLSPQSSLSNPVDFRVAPPHSPLPSQTVQNLRKSSDNRRWSVASVASSGYSTTAGSNQSLTSSNEKMNPFFASPPAPSYYPAVDDPGIQERFSSGESNSPLEPLEICDPSLLSPASRPRSRSFRFWRSASDSYHSALSPSRAMPLDTDSTFMMNSVYRERFPKAVLQMEDKLSSFIEQYSDIPSDEETDGTLCFVHRQIVTLGADVLDKSRGQLLSSLYFAELADKLEQLGREAHDRSTPAAYEHISTMITRLLMIISRTSRLLECLEFDPDEFYHLLEQAEGQAKKVLKSSDLPKYIIGKLGLYNDPMEAVQLSGMVNSTRDDDSDVSVVPSELLDHSGGSGVDGSGGHVRHYSSDGPNTSLTSNPTLPHEEDYENIKQISNGAYGTVWLVRHKSTRQKFALKKLLKTNIMLRNQVEQVFTERDILSFTDNPFVVTLYGTFVTKKYFCMLLEFVEGGDCASLLKNVCALPLETALMYFAETILALEYIHNYGIVHRDLKPDNLLITAEGHIKLTDFGLSKVGIINLTTNLLEGILEQETRQFKDGQIFGTPEYIAPEVILRQGYGVPVDWWSMGIILYQFLIGSVPFNGDTPEELFANVLQGIHIIDWHEGDDDYDMTAEARDLIERLLQRDPLLRFGTGGAHEVQSHPIFRETDWMAIMRQKLPMEFKPQLDGEEDTSYFDLRSHYHHSDREEEESDQDDSMSRSFSSSSPRYSHMFEKFNQTSSEHDTVSRQSSDSSIISHTPGNTPDITSDSGSNSPRVSLGGSVQISAKSSLDSNESKKSSPASHTSTPKRTRSGGIIFPSVDLEAKDGIDGDIHTRCNASRSVSFESDLTSSTRPSSVSGILMASPVSPLSPMSPVIIDPMPPIESLPSTKGEGGLSHRTLRRTEALSPREAENLHKKRLDDGETGKDDIDMGDLGQISDSVFTPTDPPSYPPTPNRSSIHSSSESASSSSANSPAATSCISLPVYIGTDRNPILRTQSAKRITRPGVPTSVHRKSGFSREKHPGNLLISKLTEADFKRPRSRTTPDPEESLSPGHLPSLQLNTTNRYAQKSSSPAGLNPTTSSSPLSKPVSGSLTGQAPSKSSMFVKSASATQLSLLIPPHEELLCTSPSRAQHILLSPTSSASSRDQSPTRDAMRRPPYHLKRGKSGYGFRMKAVKVYTQDAQYYTINHIVTNVDAEGPAAAAGLQPNYLVTHINGEATRGLLQPQVVRLLKPSGKQGPATVSLRAVPLEDTTITSCFKTTGDLKKAKMVPSRHAVKKRHSYNPGKLDRRRHRSSSLLKTLSKRNAETLISAPINSQSMQSLGDVPSGAKRSPRSPRLIHMDIGLSQSFSSASSSPLSSESNSPGSSRPLSLRGLSKSLQTVKSPNRRQSVHNIPLSPLARNPTPSPLLSPAAPIPPPSKLAVSGTGAKLSASPSLLRHAAAKKGNDRSATPPAPRISVTPQPNQNNQIETDRPEGDGVGS